MGFGVGRGMDRIDGEAFQGVERPDRTRGVGWGCPVVGFEDWRKESGGFVPGLEMGIRCVGDGAVLMLFGTEVTGRMPVPLCFGIRCPVGTRDGGEWRKDERGGTGRMPVPLCLLRLEAGIPAGCGLVRRQGWRGVVTVACGVGGWGVRTRPGRPCYGGWGGDKAGTACYGMRFEWM